jgi:uncharacterized membrane protein
MSELQPSTAQPTSLTPQDNTAKINALIAYGFMAVGLFTGLFWIIGALLGQGLKKSPIGQKLDFSNHSYLCKGLSILLP